MQPQQQQQIKLTRQHLQVLQYTDVLFTRWSLRKNTYLSKHLKANLEVPLFIIAEQRRIAQITQSQSTIIEALRLSDFVQINEQSRAVKVVDLPTVKVTDESSLLKIEGIIKQYIKLKQAEDKVNSKKPAQYIISPKTDEGSYYITLKEKSNSNENKLKRILEQYIKSHPQCSVDFKCEPLYQDIKESINRVRKAKQNDQYNKNQYFNKNYSHEPDYSSQNYGNSYYPNYYYNYQADPNMNYHNHNKQMNYQKPYDIFIRRAVISDDQEYYEQEQNGNGTKGENFVFQDKKEIEQKVKQMNLNEGENGNSNQHRKQKESQKNWAGNKHNKKYEGKSNNQQKNKKGYEKKESDKEKNRTKVVLDDNDFPTIG